MRRKASSGHRSLFARIVNILTACCLYIGNDLSVDRSFFDNIMYVKGKFSDLWNETIEGKRFIPEIANG
jgi:hypothetical protein